MRGFCKSLLGIGVTLASLAVMIVFAEIFLRALMPLRTAGTYDAYRYDATYGYRLKEATHHRSTSDYLEETWTNALGTVNFQESFDPYANLVFAVGDSYTQGTGLGPDESYPFQLDLLLNLHGDEYETRYAVVNLGLAAFGLEQEMLSLDEYAKRLGPPKFVLFLGCSNDVADDELFLSGYRHRHLVEGNPHYGVMLEPMKLILNEFEIGKRVKLLRARLARSEILGDDSGDSSAAPNRVNVAQQQQARLDRLLAKTRELGAHLIVSWADTPNPPGPSYAWLRDWAERNGVAFADWRPGVVSVERSIPAAPIENAHSSGHFRPWVNQVIARAYAREILAVDERKGH